MPKVKYIDKNFRSSSHDLINKINGVIKDYGQQGYRLTLRQVYYQMVARDIIPNNERSYKNLGALINDARLAGLIDWYAIEDRTRNLQSRTHWTNPGHIIDSAAYSYHLDYWKNQENYVEVWIEKDALVGVIGKICNELDVNYFSCRGYVSQSEMWSAAQRLSSMKDQGKNIILLHLGDHDPSGIDMSRDIRDRQILFENFDFEFKRLALNMEQIEEFSPPPNPTKLSDSRATGYIGKYGYECWELDALEPKVINGLIEKNVLKYRDEQLFQEVKQRENEEISSLQEVADHFDLISENWTDILERYCEVY